MCPILFSLFSFAFSLSLSLSRSLPPPSSKSLRLFISTAHFFIGNLAEQKTNELPHSPPRPIEPTEPDFGSDEFEDTTVTFYDSSACTNATDTEVYTAADLYELYGVEDGTSCSPSGDFDLNTVIHCSDGSPAAVYYEVTAISCKLRALSEGGPK